MSASPSGWMMNLRRLFITASILWVALLVVAPFAATQSSPGQVLYAIAFAVYGAGRFICHQLPERSFYLWTAQLPVCARCTGIYVGGAIAAIVAATRQVRPPGATDLAAAKVARSTTAKRARKGWQRRPEPRRRAGVLAALDRLGMDSPRARVLLAVAAVPTAVTLVYEWTTGIRPSNMIRALAGAPLGAAIVLIIAAALAAAVLPAPAPTLVGRKVN